MRLKKKDEKAQIEEEEAEIHAGNDDEIEEAREEAEGVDDHVSVASVQEVDEDHGIGIKRKLDDIDDDLSTTSNASVSASQQELKEKLAILAAQWGSTQEADQAESSSRPHTEEQVKSPTNLGAE